MLSRKVFSSSTCSLTFIKAVLRQTVQHSFAQKLVVFQRRTNEGC